MLAIVQSDMPCMSKQNLRKCVHMQKADAKLRIPNSLNKIANYIDIHRKLFSDLVAAQR